MTGTPMRGGARAVRLAAMALGVGLLLAGSLRGGDDAFPFGPFRMYATAGKQNGTVRTATLTGVRADGRQRHLAASSFGMRRAEFEGQFPRFRVHPELLGDLAGYYARHHGVRFTELRLEEKVVRVVRGHVQPGFHREVVATWKR